MCTAITFQARNHYFGRNLDLEYSFNESVIVTPRNYSLFFRCAPPVESHYAMIGIATVADSYPLYYDATNEYGLSMAALNFPENAVYYETAAGLDNIAPFEFIPWILCQCRTLKDVYRMLDRINIAKIPFSDDYPLSPLHWIIADRHEAITVETLLTGMNVHKNPVGVLTNNPPFDYHLHNLANYMNLTHAEPVNRFSDQITLMPYSRGMGAIGLPGDLSSASRFVRAAFTKLNSSCKNTEEEGVAQFFHILGSVVQQQGCVKIGNTYEKTIYSSCCNTDQGIYYYTTYNNSQITAVNLQHEDLDKKDLSTFPLKTNIQIQWEN